MRRFNGALAAIILAAARAHAAWQAGEWQTESSTASGLEHRQSLVQNAETGARATIHLAVFPAKNFMLRVVDQPDPNGVDISAIMQREGAVAGVNGGYFDPHFAPLGLRVVSGKTTAPLGQSRLLGGILLATPRSIEILRPAEFGKTRKPEAAVQCGPNLVDATKAVRGLNDTKAARRTFALTAAGGRAAIGYSTSVTLAELGEILSTVPLVEGMKVNRAMNLDGGSSSAFWFRRANGSELSLRAIKPVRDYVAIVPR